MSSSRTDAEDARANLRHSYNSKLDSPLQEASIVSLRSLEDGTQVGDSHSRDKGLWRKVLRMLRRRKTGREPLPGHRRLRVDDEGGGEGEGDKEKTWRGGEGWRVWWRRRWAGMICGVLVVVVLCFL
jgi:hypothetical protein